MAAALGRLLGAEHVVALEGPLGVGKTHFVQGIAAGLGMSSQTVLNSPSFSLVQSYQGGRVQLHHVDLYRLQRAEDLIELGLEALSSEGVLVVEWASLFPQALPLDRLEIQMDFDGAPTHRCMAVTALGDRSKSLQQQWLSQRK